MIFRPAMKYLIKLILFLTASAVIVGCASTDNTASNDRPISSVPWNKPQRWEGGGQLGGMAGN